MVDVGLASTAPRRSWRGRRGENIKPITPDPAGKRDARPGAATSSLEEGVKPRRPIASGWSSRKPPGGFLAPLQWAALAGQLTPRRRSRRSVAPKVNPWRLVKNQLRRCLSSSLSMRPPCSFVFPGAGAARLATESRSPACGVGSSQAAHQWAGQRIPCLSCFSPCPRLDRDRERRRCGGVQAHFRCAICRGRKDFVRLAQGQKTEEARMTSATKGRCQAADRCANAGPCHGLDRKAHPYL
jgi:hypothetical protein